MKYNIADIIVEYDCKYDMLKKRSEKYLSNNNLETDLELFVTDTNIQNELKSKYYKSKDNKELAEYTVMGTTFYKFLTEFNGFMLHSSAVVIDDEAYLFSAPCGTGKSTHTSLWLKYLADKKPYILNDDKPAIRIIDDEIYAYGTPFSGKNDISENKRAKLKAICFLERSEKNFIERIEPKDAVKMFWKQTVTMLNKEEVLQYFDTLDIILKRIPIYKLGCDMSEDAVKLSYNTMRGENTDEN